MKKTNDSNNIATPFKSVSDVRLIEFIRRKVAAGDLLRYRVDLLPLLMNEFIGQDFRKLDNAKEMEIFKSYDDLRIFLEALENYSLNIKPNKLKNNRKKYTSKTERK